MSAQTAEKKPFLPSRAPRGVAAMSTLPQVNLLPPEVRVSRQLSTTKRRLALALAGVLVVVGLGFGYGLLRAHQADDELAAAQRTQTTLQGQVQQYHDVTGVLTEIDQVGTQRTHAMTDDVVWRTYLDAIAAVLPDGVSIDTATITGPDPVTGSAAATSTDPLAASGIGSVALSLRSTTVPDTAAVIDALATIPGLVSPTVSAVSLTAGSDGTSSYYTVTATVTVTDGALSHRFDKQGS